MPENDMYKKKKQRQKNKTSRDRKGGVLKKIHLSTEIQIMYCRALQWWSPVILRHYAKKTVVYPLQYRGPVDKAAVLLRNKETT